MLIEREFTPQQQQQFAMFIILLIRCWLVPERQEKQQSTDNQNHKQIGIRSQIRFRRFRNRLAGNDISCRRSIPARKETGKRGTEIVHRVRQFVRRGQIRF